MWYGWVTDEMRTQFMWGDPRERDHLYDLCVDARIILKCTFEQWGGMDWFDVAQDWDRWRAVVKAVMNLRVA
jgi:hypothetical protein